MSTTRMTRRLHARSEVVYAALIDPVAIAAWRVPDDMRSEIHVFEPHVGGAFRISLSYDGGPERGKSSGRTDTYHGHFAELVPDRRVVEVLEFETDDPAMKGEMRLTWTLASVGDDTELTAVQEGVPAGVRPEDNELGWRMALDKLAKLVESPR